MHGPTLIITALTLLSSQMAKDETWTLRNGTTYHHVNEIDRSNQQVDINCDEGKRSVQLADMPATLQLRYHYDAPKEAAMNAYLIRLRNESSLDEIRAYRQQVQRLDADPELLGRLSEVDLVWLLNNRLLGGGYISYKLPPEEANALVHDEVPLVGRLVMEIESKSNPSFDLKTPMSANDLPIDIVNPHATPEQRVAYEAKVAATRKRRMAFYAELEIRRQIEDSIEWEKHYLRVLYKHSNDDGPIEADVRPLMSRAGVDSATIDLLLGKTTYKVR